MKKFIKIIFVLIILLSITGIIYFSYNIINWNLNVNENKKIKEDQKKLIKVDNDNKDKYIIDFKKLKEINSDTVAYIKVNNTNIDYSVVRGKDNSYYLNHNFNKEYNIAGWIFADYNNKFDGTDKNIILYGHDTKDGSMFETLKYTLNKDWQDNKDNRIVTLTTEKDTYKYEAFSTYTIKPEDYYINTEFNNDNEFNNFINKLKSRSIYDYNVDLTNTKDILTLSSCYNLGNKRVVLHARKINEEKSE